MDWTQASQLELIVFGEGEPKRFDKRRREMR